MREIIKWFGLLLMPTLVLSAQTKITAMTSIQGGRYQPLYGGTNTIVEVDDFYMDNHAVTIAQFADFITQYPQWNKNNIKALFAEENYLWNWEENVENNKEAPVTYVSWFAAKAYCECQGKRLPTIEEWEYVALANKTLKDARTETTYNQYILDWYERPKTIDPKAVKSTFKNAWGIYDMHGLIWEWTLDFNSILISGESRKDGSSDRNLFCGSSALGASDLMNYAAFIRYAFRGSVEARYTIKNLGFRCVKDPL